MKKISLGFLVLLTLAAVSCGKKSGGDSGSDGPNSENYSTSDDSKMNWGTGVITINGRNYYPPNSAQSPRISQNSVYVINQAYASKGNVQGLTSGSTNTGYGYMPNVIYRVRVESILTNDIMYGGYPNIGSGANSQKVLDIRSMKFLNYR